MKVKKNKRLRPLEHLSVLKKLRKEGKIDDSFLVCLNSLELEDIIAIKLELSARLLNHRPYGFDIWKKIPKIVKESILKFSISSTASKKAAARFLGLTSPEFNSLYKNYDIQKYFDKNT